MSAEPPDREPPTAITLEADPRPPAAGEARPDPVIDKRFVVLGSLGTGGSSEVLRVHDRHLDRPVAMKLQIRGAPDRAAERFMAEARIAAGLQHPGITPVYEAGTTDGGRRWLTMRQVEGRRLTDLVADARDGDPAAALRRLLTVFARICEAVAFAHARGIVHRDLKPSNVMVGRFGEVIVLDWGIACAAADADAPRDRRGPVVGTPGFMAPEQARGEPVDARADVFSLGRVLAVVFAAIEPRATVDDELVELRDRCLCASPTGRPPDAGVVGRAVEAWLAGARRRADAQALVDRAAALLDEIERAARRAEAVEDAADAALAPLASSAPVEEKAPGWRLEDEAAAAWRAIEERRVDYEQLLQAALIRAPDLAAARARLAEHYRARAIGAEAARDPAAAHAFAVRLRAIDPDLHAAFVSEGGTLSLATTPPGASVWCAPYVERARRLEVGEERLLGVTPLDRVPLPRGGHRLRVVAEGCPEVLHTLHLGRGEHWDQVAPGEAAPGVLPLPTAAEHPDGCVYVPPGWFYGGGDRRAVDGLPRRRVWVEGFFIERDPLTCGALVEALNEMVAAGRAALAARIAPPSAPREGAGSDGALSIERTPDGRYVLERRDAEGPIDRWPVTRIDWHGAVAWAAWRAERTGLPWRLPHELEREKAARGADGRLLPWGDFFDPTWANVLGGREGKPGRLPVGEPPTDVSPYGVRGLAGNVRDWCHNVFLRRGLPRGVARLVVGEVPADDRTERLIRGGGCWARPDSSRPAGRFAERPDRRFFQVSVRLVCPYPFVDAGGRRPDQSTLS